MATVSEDTRKLIIDTAVKELKDLDSIDNPEYVHTTADNTLLGALAAAGYIEIAKAYQELKDNIGFWYG